jgi:predicted nucleotidyltransferase
MAVETIQDNPTLLRFRAALAEVYGDRIERLVLFGSRARGEAQTDSDYDIPVFLHDMPDRGRELIRLADIGTDILYSGGGVINALPYAAGAYRERTPFMREIRRDGIDL